MTKESKAVIRLREGFEDFYQKNLQSYIAEYRDNFSQQTKKFITINLIAVLTMIIVFTCLDLKAGLVSLFLLCIPYYQYKNAIFPPATTPYSDGVGKGKEEYNRLFAEYFDGFSYSEKTHTPQEYINKSKIISDRTFPHDINYRNVCSFYGWIYLHDYFQGSYKGHNISIDNQLLKGLDNLQFPVFLGVLITINLKEKIEGQIIGVQNNKYAQKNFNLEGLKVNIKGFDDHWSIHTENKPLAQKMLDNELKEKLLVLQKQFMATKIEFSIFEDVMFIALHTKKDILELPRYADKTSNQDFAKINLEQFLATFSVVDAIIKDKD